MGLANNEKESPLMYMHVYTMIANKLNCKVQVAVFIFINRVKQQCQHGMRLRQEPSPILVVMHYNASRASLVLTLHKC